MNFRQLECFVAVVDEGSFTRAARRVGITQPSLSQHIKALELELEGALLDRLPRGVSLTPAGRSLLPEARTAVRALERGRQGIVADRFLEGRARAGEKTPARQVALTPSPTPTSSLSAPTSSP